MTVDEETSSKIDEELGILEQLEHPNIVSYLSAMTENGRFYMAMEVHDYSA